MIKTVRPSKLTLPMFFVLSVVFFPHSKAHSQKVSSQKSSAQKVSSHRTASRKASSKKAAVQKAIPQSASTSQVYYDTVKKQKYLIVEVHKTYENVLDKGYESLEMLEYLGNFYFKCNDYKKSKLYFDRLFKNYKVSQISPKSIEHYEVLAECIVR